MILAPAPTWTLLPSVGWRFSRRCARAAERNALGEVAVVADDGGLADHDAHAVVDEQALADRSRRVNLDARPQAIEVGDQPGQERDARLMQRVRQAVQLPSLETGVGQDDRNRAMCRRVAVKRCLDVSANALDKGQAGGLRRSLGHAGLACSGSGVVLPDEHPIDRRSRGGWNS